MQSVRIEFCYNYFIYYQLQLVKNDNMTLNSDMGATNNGKYKNVILIYARTVRV